jgi:hypothetical protein
MIRGQDPTILNHQHPCTMEKKVGKTDPIDWGTDTIKTPGMYTISQLEAMLPDAVPQEEVREWERDLNQRRVWRPCVKDEKIEKKQEHKHPLDASVSKQQ